MVDDVRLRRNDAHVRGREGELPGAGPGEPAATGLALQLLNGVHLFHHAVCLQRHLPKTTLLVDSPIICRHEFGAAWGLEVGERIYC